MALSVETLALSRKNVITVDINSGHSFETTIARDAFFVTNPTQLKENMYIYCNGLLQQYISTVWTDRSLVIKGAKGEAGTNGVAGTNGADGLDGADGSNGANGINGVDGIDGIDGVGIVSVVDNGDNTFTINLSNSTSQVVEKIDTLNLDKAISGTTNKVFTATQETKLDSIDATAQPNNISDANATLLTASNDTTLHYHSSDRNRTNHTGTQEISTVIGLQTAIDDKTNKNFTSYTQKADVVNDDMLAINDSADSNSIKYVTLNQLISSVQDPHNKGYYATGLALNTAIPTSVNGDFAVVGETNTIWVWSGTAFVNSGASGEVSSLNGRTGIVTLTKTDVGLDNVPNLDTSTTANITDSIDKRFVTDAKLVVIGDTSGINTGDETNLSIKTKLGEDLTNKVDIVAGKSLVLDTDIVKLTNLSGTNTGDETTATIKTKLGNVSTTEDGYLTSTQYNALSSSSSGDMTKAVYDTTNNGIVDNAEKVGGFTVGVNVPSNAVFTDTTYTAGTNVEITAENVINVTGGSSVDSILSGTSENPVQNKVVKTALDSKVDSILNMGLSSNNFTDILKTKLDGLLENKSPITDLSSTTQTVIVANNQEYCYGTLTSLNVTCDIDVKGSISFSSGTPATSITSSVAYKYIGAECDTGVFTPISNKRYILAYSYDGINILGVVGGYSI